MPGLRDGAGGEVERSPCHQKAPWSLQGLSEDTEEEKPAESTFTADR